MGLLRVLILEDDEDIVDLIRTILDGGFEIIAAGDGLMGLELAEVAEPDLVICDIMMPVMDGWEFIRSLRARGGFERTPVIFLTALSSAEHIRKGYSLGASLYLVKPIESSRLKRNIELFISDHGIEPRPKSKRIDQLRPTPEAYPKFIMPSAQPLRPQARKAIITPPPPGYEIAPDPPRPAAPRANVPPSQQPRPAAPPPPPRGFSPSPPPAASKPAARPAPHMPSFQADDAGRVRILVVDDDKDTCQMLSAGLGEKFDVVEARDGITAIDRAIQYIPDIFIIDGMLPRMTDYQLTQMLKKNRNFYMSPIIFISGKATQRDQEYAKTLGITQFIAKPFTIYQMLAAIQTVIERPDFAVHANRVSMKQVRLENFAHLEANRKTAETPSLSEIEQRAVDNQLKKQMQ